MPPALNVCVRDLNLDAARQDEWRIEVIANGRHPSTRREDGSPRQPVAFWTPFDNSRGPIGISQSTSASSLQAGFNMATIYLEDLWKHGGTTLGTYGDLFGRYLGMRYCSMATICVEDSRSMVGPPWGLDWSLPWHARMSSRRLNR